MKNCRSMESFIKACELFPRKEKKKLGIGTLREKMLHAVIKDYLEPDKEKQEIRVGGYIADICDGTQIVEIQSTQFNRLRDKLSTFLMEYEVTIAYPIAGKKRLFWVEKDSGEITGGRLSPKKGTVYDSFFELYKIKSFLNRPNLHFIFLVIDIEEYRVLDGYSKDRKKGGTKLDKIPINLIQELCISCREDFSKFLPEKLKKTFTSEDFAKAAYIPKKTAQVALNILLETKTIRRIGKEGRNFLYEKS